MYCGNCGTKNEDGTSTCTSCGATLISRIDITDNPTAQQIKNRVPTDHTRSYHEMIEAELPAKFKPMGAWSYFGHSILFAIPIIGFIFLLVFALGGTANVNKRNYARSYFCPLLIALCIFLLAISIIGITSCTAAQSTSRYYYSYY